MNPIAREKMDRMGIKVVVAVFFALVIDGMNYQMLSLSLTVLMKDFNISKVMAGSFGTCLLFGMGCGGVLAGWLSDRLGRTKVVFGSIAAFVVTDFTLCFTQNYIQFAIVCFLTGFGMIGIYNIGTMMAAEYIPTGKRTTLLGALQAGWSVGYVIAALLSTLILSRWGWRPMFMVSIVPALLTLWLLHGVKDPPSYLAARKLMAGKKQNTWKDLFTDKSTKRVFLLWAVSSLFLQFGYYGATTWLPSYVVKELGVDLKSMGFYVAGTYVAMVVGKVLAGRLGDVLGRRAMWLFTALATAVVLPLIMKFATPTSVVYLLPAFGLLYGAPYAILNTYLSESFPTKIRGTAVSTTNALGKIGSMLSPLLIGAVAGQYSIAAGIAFLGIAYAVTGLIPGLFIREKMYDPKSIAPEGTSDIVRQDAGTNQNF